jgi:hypothetical protein
MDDKLSVLMNMSMATLARQKVILNLLCHLIASGDVEKAKEIHAEACDVIDVEEKNIIEAFGYLKP